jgi:hypothetical protein
VAPVISGAGGWRGALAVAPATLEAKVSTESWSLTKTASAADWRLDGSGWDAIWESGAIAAWWKAEKPSSVIIQATASSSKVLTHPFVGSHLAPRARR